MAGERDSGYGFVHFEEGEEGVAAAFKAIHTITTAVIINDVEYVCEASQNLLRQVQMMNKARGQYIDPSTGDFVRLPRPSTNESTGERYMGGGGNPNFSRDSTIIGSGQGPISSKSQHIEQNRYVNYGNQSAVSDDHYRSQHTSNFPGRSSGGFSGNHDPYYGEASRKSSQSDYPSQSQLSQSRGQSGAQNESTFSGKSMGQFTRPGTAQMRPSPEYYPPSVHTSNSQRPSFSLDASSHSNESPPGYSYPSRSKAVSLNGSPPPPDSVSNKNRQSQFVDLSSFGLDSSTHGSSSTSMQVDISSFMSSLRLSDTESSEQRHVNQPPMMASMNGISSTNPRIATDSDFPSRATQGYTFPSTAARTPFNKGVSTNN